ncbi:MAG: ABC transporter ATP-binding protein [Lentisphaerae bacterium]|jgi:ABC-type multidrug transport system ATPase subunit|nr:ABC transporter ATP-binding protein [Lentisphaerota bacterium]MBT4816455.1 ABC transporter ATP-binding protein [Lentisphaerota bacterium]MBT5604408.1 ABC transporter ATP-binding protein [Lentisphaerota bacterium]MBT7059782.1 ABC transporter ATP-binding protein [Lentisphaerota bacterium]MBT7843902.1 ABC transporter ATP-binding protein [Lentisphaerota bacterium]
MPTHSPALTLTGLTKTFGRHRAVDDVTLDVNQGEMVGFLGPNGAGKSTTLYMITRLVRPTAGSIHVFGHDVRRSPVEALRHIGALVETPSFYGYLSGRRNLELVARVYGIRDRTAVDEILAQIGLTERQKDPVQNYSQGMKQRLGLGAALLGSPRLLLLDEPTNGLDPEAMREILGLVRNKVRQDGLAVFISSHLLGEVEEYCDRVAIMNGGKLACEGHVDEILAQADPVVRVTFSGDRPAPDTFRTLEGIETVVEAPGGALEFLLTGQDSAWLNRQLLERGFPVATIAPKQRTLREFFLALTGTPPDSPPTAPHTPREV